MELLYLINASIFRLLCYIYIVDSKDLEDGSTSVHKAKAGTAAFLIELENKRSIKASGYMLQGICAVQFSHICLY